MPFSGKKFEDLYNERLLLKDLVESYDFDLTEQFVGYQFKEDFESKDYDPKGIHYLVTDAYDNEFLENVPKRFIGNTDIVVGYFAIDHAMNEKELINISKNIFGLLKEGGSFVGMSDMPESKESLSTKYGVVLSLDEKNPENKEGMPRRVSIYKENKEVTHFHNFIWSKDTVVKNLEDVGFKDINISSAKISPEIKIKSEKGFWDEYKQNPDQVIISAKK
jgi:hypothetical protein